MNLRFCELGLCVGKFAVAIMNQFQLRAADQAVINTRCDCIVHVGVWCLGKVDGSPQCHDRLVGTLDLVKVAGLSAGSSDVGH